MRYTLDGTNRLPAVGGTRPRCGAPTARARARARYPPTLTTTANVAHADGGPRATARIGTVAHADWCALYAYGRFPPADMADAGHTVHTQTPPSSDAVAVPLLEWLRPGAPDDRYCDAADRYCSGSDRTVWSRAVRVPPLLREPLNGWDSNPHFTELCRRH